jgi:hypothetical protein
MAAAIEQNARLSLGVAEHHQVFVENPRRPRCRAELRGCASDVPSVANHADLPNTAVAAMILSGDFARRLVVFRGCAGEWACLRRRIDFRRRGDEIRCHR